MNGATQSLAAAALAGLAVLVLLPPAPQALLRRRAPGSGAAAARAAPVRRWAVVAVLVGACAVLVVLTGTRPGATVIPLAATGALVAVASVVLLRRSRGRARARRRRAGVIEACDALAAGLRAGQPPPAVLARVAADVDLLAPAAAASRLGGDVSGGLRSSARLDGAEGLHLVAAAWTVALRSGAGLADVVSRIAGTVRSEAEQLRQVEVALGTSRSTARLLAGLPLMGILLGSGLGADPLGVLIGTPVGAWCLLAGTTLALAGVLWVERLADGALR